MIYASLSQKLSFRFLIQALERKFLAFKVLKFENLKKYPFISPKKKITQHSGQISKIWRTVFHFIYWRITPANFRTRTLIAFMKYKETHKGSIEKWKALKWHLKTVVTIETYRVYIFKIHVLTIYHVYLTLN